MSGVNLSSLEVDDMLDVLHYLFEEDMYVGSIEEIESRKKTRKLIYEEMYGREYEYGVTTKPENDFYSDDIYPDDGYMSHVEDEGDHIVPFDPDDSGVEFKKKPYIPPTDFNPNSSMPFGSKIDGPLG